MLRANQKEYISYTNKFNCIPFVKYTTNYISARFPSPASGPKRAFS